MIQYIKYSFAELINIAESKCGYKFDGDPTGRGEYSDGILLALNLLGKDYWEFICFCEYYFYFKRMIVDIKL